MNKDVSIYTTTLSLTAHIVAPSSRIRTHSHPLAAASPVDRPKASATKNNIAMGVAVSFHKDGLMEIGAPRELLDHNERLCGLGFHTTRPIGHSCSIARHRKASWYISPSWIS